MNTDVFMESSTQKTWKKNTIPLLAFFLLLAFTPFFFHSYKSRTIQNIPKETKEAQAKLDSVIILSKFDAKRAINELENLNNLPNYTKYKKNYILARLYEKNKNYDKALPIYKKLIHKNYPLKERTIFHFAHSNTKIGNDKTALKYFNKLLHDFPDSRSVPQAKYYLAQTKLRLKHTNQAINTLLSLRSEFPDSQFGIAANYYIGEHEYNKKNYKKALSHFKEYLQASPDGRFATEIADLYIKLDSEGEAIIPKEDFSLLGNVFFHKKDYSQAAKFYELENNPKNYYNLGYSLYRINKKTKAKDFLKDFAYHFPENEKAKLSLFYASECTPYYVLSTIPI